MKQPKHLRHASGRMFSFTAGPWFSPGTGLYPDFVILRTPDVCLPGNKGELVNIVTNNA